MCRISLFAADQIDQRREQILFLVFVEYAVGQRTLELSINDVERKRVGMNGVRSIHSFRN